MSASRVGISRQQRIDRLLGEQTAGAAQIVEQIRIVRAFLQRSLQIRNGFGELTRLNLRDAQRTLLMDPAEMRNRLGRVALCEQRIPEKLISWDKA